ncbi:wd-repeat protein [Metarhizium album ARSEF 1941]|uniref:Intraflagellar transport protein 122 homolog n=1 Tax=Metarhizium album (strain ARSEF 1941) TaxID=1081103 RepID=A0A0B2WE50_METAS|nr:wd-repeat protein [Metarhizium album ARSEF 1941]KHN94141.1 wd-repeat protein [Metarhizium album ARSEF 1941]
MASTGEEVHTQVDGNGSAAAAPPKSEPFTPLLPTLMKSAVDQTVKAVTAVVQTEIRALPRRIVAAVAAQQAAGSAKTPRRRTASSAADDDQGLPKSQQLWNDAYDGLEDSGATSGIVRSYAETLTFAIAGGDQGKPGPDTATLLAADLKDPVKRQAHMRYLVQKGRDKFADDSKLAQTVGDVAGFVLQARGVIDVAIENVPQAALPWAGVCVGLQILTNPARVSRENLAGITHVVSRMDWYCSLVDHLLDERSIVQGKEPANVVTQRLETLVLDLYKSLLLYQMKSVCSYYRNSGLTYLRELAAWDKWELDLKAITSAEEALRAASVQYNTQSSLERLSELMQHGDKMQSTLGNVHQDLQDFISTQKQRVTDDRDSACLRDLFTTDPMRDLERLERKTDKLIDIAFSWVMGTKEYASFSDWHGIRSRRMLWVKGGPGTGKTMLLMGIVREISTQSAAFAPSVSYYFCQGTGDRMRNNAHTIFRSLLWMLLIQQPRLIQHLRAKHRYAGSLLFTDSNAMSAMSEAFENMLKDPSLTPVYFVVDGLDECDGTREDLIQLIFKSLSISRKVKWLISSRPELDLPKPDMDEALVELDAQRLEGPVHAYITYKLSGLKGQPGYDDEATLVELSNEICERAANTFLWAALAFRELQGVDGKDAMKTIKQLPPGLPDLYGYMMARVEEHHGLKRTRCKNVLTAVYLAYRPLTLKELGVVAGLGSPIKPLDIVKACGSLLSMTGRVVSLTHQSVREYLCQEYGKLLEQGDAVLSHQDIASRSIFEMQHSLKHNMYHLLGNGYFPRFLGDAINGSDSDPLAGVAYSATFWIHHLCDAMVSEASVELVTSEEVLDFLKNFFLRWIESLSLLGSLSEGLKAIRLLAAQPRLEPSVPLKKFLKDAERFLVSHESTIKAATLQTYGTALLFTPPDSSVRVFGWHERLPFIRNMVTTQQTGDSSTRTLDGRYGAVTAVAFSEDGKLFSTGTEGSLTVWDVETWTPMCTIFLPDSTGVAEEISFSPDSKSVLAVYRDALHVCDLDTKTQIRALVHPEERKIVCANFQLDCKGVVMVLGDATVHVWDAVTDKLDQIFAAKGDAKSIVALSPNNKTLAVSLLQNLIGLWDIATGSGDSARVLKRHDEAFRDFTFAGDSKMLGSVSTDGTICLWDIESGVCTRSFSPGWNNWPTIALSPDLKTIAMGGSEDTTRLLDVEDWTRQDAQQSHRGRVTDVVVSADKTVAATASSDRDIRVWDIESGECLQRLRGHKDAVRSVAFSPDGHCLASASGDKTVRVWDLKTGEALHTWKGHAAAVRCVAFSPDGRMVASSSEDRTVRLWTVETGASVPIKGQSESQLCIAFSDDGKTLASINKDGAFALWETETGNQVHVFGAEEADCPTALAFSPDDSAVMVGTVSGAIYALEKASDSRRQVLKQQETFSHMAFAADGETVVTTAGSVSSSASGQTWLNKKAPDNTLFVYKPVAFPGMEGEARLGDVWIEGRGILTLLPTSYASNVLAVCEDIVILGHASGKVTFLYFDFPKRPDTYSA